MRARSMKSTLGLVLAALLLPALAAAAKPFKVLCYSAYRDGQAPGGGAQPTDAQIKEDLQMLLPYTYGIRIYSLGGHNGRIPAIADQVGMEVHVGIWLDDNDAANQKAIEEGIAVLKAGHKNIRSVIVGNEYLLRQEIEFKRNLAESEAKLVAYIKQVKQAASGVPVGTAEPYWWWIKTSRALWEECDVIFWQVHPWWDNQNIANSVNFITDLHNKVRAKIASFNLTNPNKRDVISETGWPTAINRGGAVGSVANQQTFVQKLHAWAYPANMEYWYFCPFDEKWKDEAGGVGPVWGIWNSDRTPKATVTNLDQLIPANLRYASGWGPVGIRSVGRRALGPKEAVVGEGAVNALGRMVEPEKKNPAYRVPVKKP